MAESSWSKIQSELLAFEKKHKRPITLVAVSKGQSTAKIERLFAEKDPPKILGESYLDEALEKRPKLSVAAQKKIDWHFIGRLQSRKIAEIAKDFSCLHTVARIKEIEALSKAPSSPKFFLQVNTSGEEQKNGFATDEIEDALEACAKSGILKNLLGLMTLPSPLDEAGEAQLRKEFALLRSIRDRSFPKGLLNMGTSGDYAIAIDEGADWIRLGTIIFGERD